MSKKVKNPYKYQNPEAFKAHVERCRSSAASKQGDRRTKRIRTRSAQKMQDIKMSW